MTCDDNGYCRPDPWFVREIVAREFERLALHLVDRLTCLDVIPQGHARIAVDHIRCAIDHHVSRMRGELGREADEQARQREAQEQPFKTAEWR